MYFLGIHLFLALHVGLFTQAAAQQPQEMFPMLSSAPVKPMINNATLRYSGMGTVSYGTSNYQSPGVAMRYVEFSHTFSLSYTHKHPYTL